MAKKVEVKKAKEEVKVKESVEVTGKSNRVLGMEKKPKFGGKE